MNNEDRHRHAFAVLEIERPRRRKPSKPAKYKGRVNGALAARARELGGVTKFIAMARELFK